MTDGYRQLLDATIAHLQGLKAGGARRVSVQAETLAALAAPVPQAIRHLASSAAPTIVRPQSAAATASKTPSAAAPAFATPPLDREGKESAMAALRQQAEGCVQCPELAAARTQVVFGVGDVHSALMFVGEAPGAEEDERGEPCVGEAGQLLMRIIQTMGFGRDSVYIANLLKCRSAAPGQDAVSRKPASAEMENCSPWLLRQIDIVRPRAIVALGATAVQGLFGKGEGIARLRGRWQEFRGIPVMPTYHPAYLLRNQALSEKRKVWEDMLLVLEKLGAPISEKQRGYFLKA